MVVQPACSGLDAESFRSAAMALAALHPLFQNGSSVHEYIDAWPPRSENAEKSLGSMIDNFSTLSTVPYLIEETVETEYGLQL